MWDSVGRSTLVHHPGCVGYVGRAPLVHGTPIGCHDRNYMVCELSSNQSKIIDQSEAHPPMNQPTQRTWFVG
jgi:hypothetical protein